MIKFLFYSVHKWTLLQYQAAEALRLQQFVLTLHLLSAVTQQRSRGVEWFQHHHFHSGHIHQVVTSGGLMPHFHVILL